MKPKRTQTRSRLCGRANTVTTPVAVAWSRTAATSCEATSSGSVSRTTAGRGPPERLPVLLLAKHRVLQALREAELAHTLGRNLEGLAGLWIPADARLAIREDQLAEARQEEHAALLGFLRRQVERLVEDTLDLLPGEAGLLRKVRDRCRLRHRLRHG